MLAVLLVRNSWRASYYRTVSTANYDVTEYYGITNSIKKAKQIDISYASMLRNGDILLLRSLAMIGDTKAPIVSSLIYK